MMRRLGLFLMASVTSVLAPTLGHSSPSAPLETVPFVDVKSYLGTWYQIARNPLPFEGDCACSQQTLGQAAGACVAASGRSSKLSGKTKSLLRNFA